MRLTAALVLAGLTLMLGSLWRWREPREPSPWAAGAWVGAAVVAAGMVTFAALLLAGCSRERPQEPIIGPTQEPLTCTRDSTGKLHCPDPRPPKPPSPPK